MPDWKKEISVRLAGSRLAPTRQAEIVEELAQYLEDCYEELLADGTTEADAWRKTSEQLNQSGLLTTELNKIERPVRREPMVLGARRINMVQDFWRDLGFGIRILLKSKVFTIVTVLSLALGIGANTALFSVVDAVLLKTLPVAEPERLVLFAWSAGLPFRVGGMSGTSNVPNAPGTRALSLFRYEVFDRMRQSRAASPDSPLSDFFGCGVGANEVRGWYRTVAPDGFDPVPADDVAGGGAFGAGAGVAVGAPLVPRRASGDGRAVRHRPAWSWWWFAIATCG
jgi:hypothetical protein